jgi:hypothetical protein
MSTIRYTYRQLSPLLPFCSTACQASLPHFTVILQWKTIMPAPFPPFLFQPHVTFCIHWSRKLRFLLLTTRQSRKFSHNKSFKTIPLILLSTSICFNYTDPCQIFVSKQILIFLANESWLSKQTNPDFLSKRILIFLIKRILTF